MKLKYLMLLSIPFLPSLAFAQTATNSAANGYSASGSEAVVAPVYNENTPSTQTIHNNTQAPDVVVSGANQCGLPLAGTGSILGVGLGFAGTPTDKGCEHRNDANAMNQLGLRTVAIAIMCEQSDVQTAMNEEGIPCPTSQPASMSTMTTKKLPPAPPSAPAPKPQVIIEVVPVPMSTAKNVTADQLNGEMLQDLNNSKH